MKKILSTILIMTILLITLSGCIKIDRSPEPYTGEIKTTEAIETLETMGDVFALDGAEELQSSYSDTSLFYTFGYKGAIYRVYASSTVEIFEAATNSDYSEEKFKELVAPQKIEEYENLSKDIIPQEELDKLKGKTGQQLLDEGWSYRGCNVEKKEFYLDNGIFTYAVTFEEEPEVSEDNYDDAEVIKPLHVKSVVYNSMGLFFVSEEGAAWKFIKLCFILESRINLNEATKAERSVAPHIIPLIAGIAVLKYMVLKGK